MKAPSAPPASAAGLRSGAAPGPRGPGQTMKSAHVSVVVASGAGGEFLLRCLDSLRDEALRFGAEVLVVDRCGPGVRERVSREHPWVRVLAPELGHRPSVPELRREGLLAARGEVVAVLEEHCTAPAGWIAAIAEAFDLERDAALGGPILDDDFDRLRDWVVYFSEYNNFMPPWEPGERLTLNGANIAYAREKVLRHLDVLDDGYWEVVLHPRLAREGRFRALPEMGAHHTGPFDYGYYLRQRYLLSRVWGGSQKDASGLKRLMHVLGAPLFPFYMLARIAGRVLSKGAHVGKFVLALPLLIPVICAYTLGEWLGYLVGTGGALEEVE